MSLKKVPGWADGDPRQARAQRWAFGCVAVLLSPVLIFAGVLHFSPNALTPAPSHETAAEKAHAEEVAKREDQQAHPETYVMLTDQSWNLTAFGTAMALDGTIKNANPFPVKDIMIECYLTALSGTRLGDIHRIMYRAIGPGGSTKLRGFIVGRLPDQTATAACKVIQAPAA